MSSGDITSLLYLSTIQQLVLASKNDDGYLLVVTKSGEAPSAVPNIADPEKLLIANDRVVIIDSINSGTGRTEKKSVYHALLKPLFDDYLGVAHEYHATVSADSIHQFAQDIEPLGKPLTVILISGDTSVNEFVNGLSEIKSPSSLKLFVIPSGTGNSLALSIGIENELQAIQKLVNYDESHVRALNLYESKFPVHSKVLSQDKEVSEINGPVKFLVVISWAFHASLVADSDTPELRKHGIDRFKLAAFSNLAQTQKYDGEVTFGDKKISGPFAYFVVTSSKKFEPTFEISPKGDIFDDNLYLISFSTEEDDKEGKYIMEIMGQVYSQGSHAENPKVTYERVSKGQEIVLKIKNAASKRKRRFCLDGTIIAIPEEKDSEIVIKATGSNYNNWELKIIH